MACISISSMFRYNTHQLHSGAKTGGQLLNLLSGSLLLTCLSAHSIVFKITSAQMKVRVLTKYDGRLQSLHDVDDDALHWLKTTVTNSNQEMKWKIEKMQLFRVCARPRTHGDAGRHQSVRIHDSRQLMQQVRRLLEQLRCIPLHHVFQQLGFRTRHTVPRLRLAPDNITPLLQHPTNIYTQVCNTTLLSQCFTEHKLPHTDTHTQHLLFGTCSKRTW